MRAERLYLRWRVVRECTLERLWALYRVRDRDLALLLDRAADFFVLVDFLVTLVECDVCEDESVEDCAATQGTTRNRDSTPARQEAVRRAENIRGTTTIIFSL
jgi:hypothetical protein